MEMPKKFKKRIIVFAKVIRKNTGYDFITCINLSKLYLKNKVYNVKLNDFHCVKEPFSWEYEPTYNELCLFLPSEEVVFTNGIYKKDSLDIWYIPEEFQDWIKY